MTSATITFAQNGGYLLINNDNPASNSVDNLSDNVGGVKFFLSTLRRALVEERHFALVDGSALPTVGSLPPSVLPQFLRGSISAASLIW